MKYLFILLFVSNSLFAQNTKILERLVALENDGITWYNIDGCSVTSEYSRYTFDEKGLKKLYISLSIRADDVKIKDDSISKNNLVVHKTEKINDKLIQSNSYYFIENSDKKVIIIWFAKTSKPDIEMQRDLVNMIINNQIPKANYASNENHTINFGNRQIELDNSCYWTYLNTIQCPGFGEMNWSVHNTLTSAKESIDNQYLMTQSLKNGKVISEEIVDVTFENVPTKARKVIYKFTGLTGMLAGVSGGKTLTIYYVAEKVRGNYMSCVMSFWNNDKINPVTNLPPLLELVMTLSPK